jgi:hypothetical protein
MTPSRGPLYNASRGFVTGTIRRLAGWTAGVALTVAALMAAQAPELRTFRTDRQDQVPADFVLSAMRQTQAGTWAVQRQGSRAFLAHRADAAAAGYALAILDRTVPLDTTVSTRLRLAGGDRSGGLVWRYEDADNFYALVLDLVRQDLSLYRVAAGNRVRLDVEDDLELDPDAWHTLKVSVGDGDIRAWLGGIRVFDDRDPANRRPSAATGRSGFVATGRTDAWFEELRHEPRRGRR